MTCSLWCCLTLFRYLYNTFLRCRIGIISQFNVFILMFSVFGIPEEKQATVLFTSLLLLLAPADTDCYGGHLHCVHHAALHLHRCHPLGHHLRHSSEILPENRAAAQAAGG